MKISKPQNILIAIFLLSFLIQLIIGLFGFSKTVISGDDLISILLKLFAVYSIHLSMITAGIFGQKAQPGARKPSNARSVFRLAVILSLIWNIILLWRFFVFFTAIINPAMEDSVGELIGYVDKIATASSFLVTGMLAYYFTSQSK
ncbi:hypothetical protein HB364_13530 [Pseudoflavitalea sp. X16]|uniref:hypothetical protein n=1 Tax=Paraflavitalea devenefica TaxID=2716334 RepID=UPI00142494A7|nr:hypothetical protein [Paraflavitalea devenefica]NII26110.1 hypothetical protein [Paraflavitalea devenefica]